MIDSPADAAAFDPQGIPWTEAHHDGTKSATLIGSRDPGEMFSYAFFIPAGFYDGPHSHSAAAHLQVAAGVLRLGYGPVLDHGAARAYPSGSFLYVPAGASGVGLICERGRLEAMRVLTYQTAACPTLDELIDLYHAVGWGAYTKDPARLEAAVSASLAIVTARQNGELIGLARVVGDGQTIVYLQDILIRPTHQRRGIGRELFQRVFAPYSDVRQKVLITDDEVSQRAFYESMGFTETGNLEYPIRTFVQLG